jgi:hypothetical protein
MAWTSGFIWFRSWAIQLNPQKNSEVAPCKGPKISIIWEENKDFEISTPCAKCFKPQLAWNR